MTVPAVLDRKRVPQAAPSGPRALSCEDAHVPLPRDLPPSRVRCVVDISERDCRCGLTERGAVIIETRVRHPDDLLAAVEAEGPVAVVPREVRLNDPVRLRVQGVDRLDGIDEFDRWLIGERGDESGRDSRRDPSEVSGPEGAEYGRSASARGDRRDSRMAEPGFNRFRRFSRENND